MSYIRPTLMQISEQIENDFNTRLGGQSKPLRFSVTKILSRVFAGATHLVYGYIEHSMKQIIPDTASSEYLERWALIWNIRRKPATKAEGAIIFNGVNGTIIPHKTQVQTIDNFIYETQHEALIENSENSVSVKIEAVIPTKDGNLKGGTSLSLISPITNIKSIILDEKGTYNGSDIESDDSLRMRFLDRIRNVPCAGNKKDYESWALQFSGVTRAWCFSQHNGDGNVGVSFVRDNDKDIIPNAKEIEDVKNYILDRMPCTANLLVFPPIPKKIKFVIRSNNLSDEFRKQIIDQLKYLFFNIANPSTDVKNNYTTIIYLSEILECLSLIKTSRIELEYPKKDIDLSKYEVGIVEDVLLRNF